MIEEKMNIRERVGFVICPENYISFEECGRCIYYRGDLRCYNPRIEEILALFPKGDEDGLLSVSELNKLASECNDKINLAYYTAKAQQALTIRLENEKHQKEIAEITTALDKEIEVIRNMQGEWVSVTDLYAPDNEGWVAKLRDIECNLQALKDKYFAVFMLGIIVATLFMGLTEPLRHDDQTIYIPIPVVPAEPDTSPNNLKCYHQAYCDFIANEGSVLVFGWAGDSQHAWVELDGEIIRGNGSDFEPVWYCYHADEWLWMMGKWDAGFGVGNSKDMTGNWWVAGDGNKIPMKDFEWNGQ